MNKSFPKTKLVLLSGAFQPKVYDRLKGKNVFLLEGRTDMGRTKDACRELNRRGITPVMITDNAAGFLFARNLVKECWVSYHSVEKEGLLCDIGAMIVGVLAKAHQVALFAAPGIHQKRYLGRPQEICFLAGRRTAPKGIKGYVPLIEFLPKKYVRKIHA